MPNPLSSMSALGRLGESVSAGLDTLKNLLSFSQQGRLLRLSVDSSALSGLASGLVVERAEGVEGLDCLEGFTVDVLSSSAYLELKGLMGVEAGLSVVTADGGLRSWYGLISQVAALGADGGLARYRLWLTPWPTLLGLREDSFVFQQQNTLDTVEALLADYPLARYELRVSDATRAALPVHAIRTQYRETDLAFLLRLLAADGLSFWIAHDADQGSKPASAAGALRHTLVITDAETDWLPSSPETIRYHRVSATESSDTISGFVSRQRIATTAVRRSGWSASGVAASGADDSAAPINDALPSLEDYDGGGDLGRADLSTAAAQRLARLRLLAHQSDSVVFTGVSSVRTLAPGQTFSLIGHPDLDARFKLCRLTHSMSNNLRMGLDAAPTASSLGERGIYKNTFVCVPADVLLAPKPLPLPADPGLLTALVVGVVGDTATTHRQHEVRIQFHFQRGLAPNAGGLTDTGWPEEQSPAGNAPGNETSGTWVRVAQALAGPDWGSVFVPRIGTEVLVAFEHGDLDRPLIVGALHNGSDLPPYQAGVDSDVDHPGVISGIHTQVLKGAAAGADASGFNQLLFDDTDAALSAQLASSLQASQINLGSLILRSPGTATRGSARGEGAELTSDAWAVLRAGQGALLSATQRAGATGTVLECQTTLNAWEQAKDLSQALSDIAAAQGSAALTTPKDLGALSAIISATLPNPQPKGAPVAAYSSPVLIQETPASAALTSPASIVHFAGQAMHLTAQGHAHLASGQAMQLASGLDTALFTHAGGITAVAANGPVSIQAQTDVLNLLADQSVSVTSTNGAIEISAQHKIVLQAGQSMITLDGGDITFAMPGLFSVKGAQQLLSGGGSDKAALPNLPTGVLEVSHWIALDYLDALTNEPMKDVEYDIIFTDGSKLSGKLDQNGRSLHKNVDMKAVKEVVYTPRLAKGEEPHPALSKLLG